MDISHQNDTIIFALVLNSSLQNVYYTYSCALQTYRRHSLVPIPLIQVCGRIHPSLKCPGNYEYFPVWLHEIVYSTYRNCVLFISNNMWKSQYFGKAVKRYPKHSIQKSLSFSLYRRVARRSRTKNDQFIDRSLSLSSKIVNHFGESQRRHMYITRELLERL